MGKVFANLVRKLFAKKPKTLALLLGGFRYLGAWLYVDAQIKTYLSTGRLLEEEVETVWERTVGRIERGLTVQGVKAGATGDITRFWRTRL